MAYSFKLEIEKGLDEKVDNIAVEIGLTRQDLFAVASANLQLAKLCKTQAKIDK